MYAQLFVQADVAGGRSAIRVLISEIESCGRATCLERRVLASNSSRYAPHAAFR